MNERVSCQYLRAAIASSAVESACRDGLLTFHQALNDFEACKSKLALAVFSPHHWRVESSDLAHAPILLSAHACLRAYNYAVHLSGTDTKSDGVHPTWLLIYRAADKSIGWLELQASSYMLLLALHMASRDYFSLAATELLIELSDYYDADNVVQFVEEGLKLLCRLNEMGLIEGAENELTSVGEAQANNN
jgi:hypothetical protein